MISLLAQSKAPSLGIWPYLILAFYLVALLALGIISLLKSRRAVGKIVLEM